MKKSSLKEYVASVGGITEASYILHVPYTTLKRWLRGGKISPIMRRWLNAYDIAA